MISRGWFSSRARVAQPVFSDASRTGRNR
ncbi:hypothetical protein GMOD_00003041 [Pyrenophora seminiperda CCB06]|uniref:Uncharacterized protein n=1 Tax=Pyrenophora seminiperda CCB06 TaxID=1302712 RepID=A0A3M7M3Z8_9PLEO|nr:hypothetical protein GMOD_00003041 [Pyrenophora seminiperda CCB06]